MRPDLSKLGLMMLIVTGDRYRGVESVNVATDWQLEYVKMELIDDPPMIPFVSLLKENPGKLTYCLSELVSGSDKNGTHAHADRERIMMNISDSVASDHRWHIDEVE